MDAPPLATLAIALLVTALLATLSRLFSSNKPQKNLPPGPKQWPIIGNLISIAGPLPHQILNQLSKKHGPLMHLRLGSQPVIIASSAEMAKQFLKTYDRIFASRPASPVGKYIGYNYKDMLWSPLGDYWRNGRKIYGTHVLNLKCLQETENIRVEERQALVSRLNALSGQNLTVKDHISRVSVSIICRMVLGKKYFSTDSEMKIDEVITLDEFLEMLQEFVELIGARNIGEWLPWISFLDLQGYIKRMKALDKKFHRFFDNVFDDHRRRRELEKDEFVANKDLVEILLLQLDNNDDCTSSTKEVKLDSDGVKGLAQDLIVGEKDTTVATVEWGMSELMKQPEIIKKATEELDRVIGRDRWVKESDLPQLPYLEAIVKETMRLHPAAVLLAPHSAVEDCNVSGYDISKGTTLFVNAWSIGRDPKVWDEPEKFWPERFIGKETNIDVKGQSFELLPFGSGRRICPAFDLGIKLVTSIMGDLLHGFNWKLPDNMKIEEISMDEYYISLVVRKFPLVASVKPRLPLYLY